jgi:hypothetical protein
MVALEGGAVKLRLHGCMDIYSVASSNAEPAD